MANRAVSLKLTNRSVNGRTLLTKRIETVVKDVLVKAFHQYRIGPLLLDSIAAVIAERVADLPYITIRSDVKLLDDLNLPLKIRNILFRNGVVAVEDIVKLGRKELAMLHGVGPKTIEVIDEALRRVGYSLD